MGLVSSLGGPTAPTSHDRVARRPSVLVRAASAPLFCRRRGMFKDRCTTGVQCALFCGDVTCLSLYEAPSLGNVYGSGVE